MAPAGLTSSFRGRLYLINHHKTVTRSQHSLTSRMCTLRRELSRADERSAGLLLSGRSGGVASAGGPGVRAPCACSRLRRSASAMMARGSGSSASHGLPALCKNSPYGHLATYMRWVCDREERCMVRPAPLRSREVSR